MHGIFIAAEKSDDRLRRDRDIAFGLPKSCDDSVGKKSRCGLVTRVDNWRFDSQNRK